MSTSVTKIPIPRFTDKDAYERARKCLTGEFAIQKYNLTLLSQLSVEGDANNVKQIQGVLDQDTITTHRIKFEIPDCSIVVERQAKLDGNTYALDSYHDWIAVHPQKGLTDPVRFARLIGAIRTAFDPIDQRSVLSYLDEDGRKYYATRDESLRRLEGMQDTFFHKLADFTLKQEQEYRKRLEELEKQFATRRDEQDKEHKRQLDEVIAKDQALAERVKAFDTRQSTYLRRDLRDQMKKVLQERGVQFQLTRGTRRLRWPIISFYALLLLIFGAGAGYFLASEIQSGQHDGWSVARYTVFTAFFGITATLFVRWLNQWFRDHANEEFRFKRLDLDIDRASWVVEMALEWHEAKGTEIPQFLLDRLTRNLFADEKSEDGPLTAGEAIGSALMGSAASAKLRLGDSEVVLDRKGLRKLNKEQIE